MRKWFGLIALVFIIGLASACGGNAAESTEPSGSSEQTPAALESPSGEAEASGSAAAGSGFKVAMVTSGSLGDNGIFDMAEAGLSQAQTELGIEYKVLEGKQDPSLYMNILQTAAVDYDLVFVNPGYQFEEPLARIAAQYPDKKFVYMDGTSDLEADNVVYMTTKDNEGSYLAGMLAAGMTTQTSVEGINADKSIGAVGAIDAPSINNFIAGYKQGATAIDADASVTALYAGAFDNPAKGQELGTALFNQNADVVFNVASLTGTGMLQAAKNTGHYAIGVDVNQCSVQPGTILASMMKRFDTGTYLIVEKALGGTLQNGEVLSFGLADQGVELFLCQETAEIVPQELIEKIEAAKQDIISGAIRVDEVK